MTSKRALRAVYAAAERRRAQFKPKFTGKAAKPPNAAELAYVSDLRKAWAGATDASMRALEQALKAEAVERDTRTDASPAQAAGAIARAIKAALAVERMRQIARGIHQQTNVFNLREIGASLAVNPLMLPELADAAPVWVGENVDLIQGVSDAVAEDIASVIGDAWAGGARWEQIRRQVGERLSVGSARLELIARDQVLKLNADLTRERHERVGIVSYRWSTSKDSRVRSAHKALEGNTYRYAEPPIVDARTGRRDNPGRDFQCRCVAIPIFPDD